MALREQPLQTSAFVQGVGEVTTDPVLHGVLVVDADPRWATAVENRVKHHPSFKVLAVTGTASNAFALIEQLTPSAIVLAVELSGTSGFDALPTIRRLAPQAEVILFSQATDARELAGHFDVFGSLSKFNAAQEFDGALDRLAEFLALPAESRNQRRTGVDRRRRQDWNKVTSERRSSERRVENLGFAPEGAEQAAPPQSWG